MSGADPLLDDVVGKAGKGLNVDDRECKGI